MINWADIFINFAAAIGLITLFFDFRERTQKSPLAQRIGWVALAAASLVSLRALFWMTGIEFFLKLALFAAVTLPLLILIATEGLMRRHAHVLMKLLAAAWVVIGGFLVFSWSNPVSFTYLNAVAQIIIPVICVSWILLRDRSQHTQAENRNMGVFIIALLFISVLTITDFPSIIDLPVRLGAIAILMVCYLMVFAGHKDYSVPRAFLEFLAMLGMILIFSTSTRLVLGQGATIATFQLTAFLFSLMLTTVILVRSISKRFGFQEFSQNNIASARTTSVEAFIEDTLLARVSSEAHMISPDQLPDYNWQDIETAFTTGPVLKREDLTSTDDENDQMNDPGKEQVLHLLDSYKASHVVLITGEAPRLILAATPLISENRDRDAYFEVVARMAGLIRQRGSHD